MKKRILCMLPIVLLGALVSSSSAEDGLNEPNVGGFLNGGSVVSELQAVNDSLSDFSDSLQSQQKTIDVNSLTLEEMSSTIEKQAKTIAANQKALEKYSKSIGSTEKSLSKLTKSFDELDSTFDDELRLKVSTGHKDSRMKIVGRVHVDYWGFPHTDDGIDALEGGPADVQDRFQFRRLRFGVRGTLPANMDYRIESEFAGGNNVEFRDAWLGFNDVPKLGKVLIGNQKRPYGLDHLNSSRFNTFTERPFVIESFNQDARRLGIQSYNYTPDESWNWRMGAFNQRLIQDEGNYTNDHWQPEFAGRLANTYWYDEGSNGRGYGHLAVSGTWAFPDGSTPDDNGSTGPDANEARFRSRPEARSANRWLDTGRIAGADNYRLVGLEQSLNYGSLNLTSEYQMIALSRDDGFGGDVSLHGGYTQVSYFLTGEHIPWKRTSGTIGRIIPHENFFTVRDSDGNTQRGLGAWQIAARYSYADFNSLNINGGEGQSLTLGLNWYWSPYSRCQFNYLHGSIDDSSPAQLSGSYDILGLRVMVDF